MVDDQCYGGRIIDLSGTVFTDYVNSEEAVKAAEWLKWVETRDDRGMPSRLVEGDIALAIDYAFRFNPVQIEQFRNDRPKQRPDRDRTSAWWC